MGEDAEELVKGDEVIDLRHAAVRSFRESRGLSPVIRDAALIRAAASALVTHAAGS